MNFGIDIQLKWIYNVSMIQKGSESKIENTEKDPDQFSSSKSKCRNDTGRSSKTYGSR